MKDIYISLDLETTGFDPNNDQVLEIAAIKFQDGKIIEEFETLINPQIEIPSMVTHITGISTETIKDAPTFDSIAPKLREFIGNYPIVGHNIDFDLTFLESKGIPILNKQFDTLHLASILLPHLPSYSLDTISRQLKITHTNKHRAMSDAHVCFELFQILNARIQQIPAKTLAEIQAQIPKSNWDLGEIFLNAKAQTPKSTKDTEESAEPKKLNLTLKTQEQLIALLDTPSPLQELINDFEPRPSQKKLLEKILKAFTESHNLLAEAGTGTGKTLAYLLSAAYFSNTFHEKIIVSTFTHNLQDQIIYKDFPLVQTLFPTLKISLLKGRRNYLSLHRFEQVKQKPAYEDHEIITVIKVLIWLNHTVTGDLDELHLQNKEVTLIDELCSLPDEQGDSSKFDEFLDRARRSAENADIVVVNHALLIQDALTLNKILPQSSYLIVDEAHHLEKTTTDALTTILSFGRFIRLWENLAEALDKLQKNSLAFDTELVDLSANLGNLHKTAIHHAEKLFDLIRSTLEQYGKVQIGLPTQLCFNLSLYNSREWQDITAQLKDCKEIGGNLQILSQKIQKLLTRSEIDDSELSNIFSKLTETYQEAAQIAESYDQKINWIVKGFDDSVHFHSAPLQIAPQLHSQLFDQKKSIILTSATLTSFGNFNYIRSELGLGEQFEEVKLPSHFSYPDQVRIIIPEDLPEPKDPRYIEECKPVIEAIIKKNGGRTLVLFTAKKELGKVFHDLAPKLKTEGLNLLAQGLTGGRGKILAHFQDEPDKCAILGTNSFWEGVDLIGPSLTCVVIQKLPFDPPDDPIISSRSAKFRKPFDEYSLPRAILRFKQGFGRLIRSAKDTGSVIILDSRLVQKAYGRDFIASLPENIQIKQCSKTEVINYL